MRTQNRSTPICLELLRTLSVRSNPIFSVCVQSLKVSSWQGLAMSITASGSGPRDARYASGSNAPIRDLLRRKTTEL